MMKSGKGGLAARSEALKCT